MDNYTEALLRTWGRLPGYVYLGYPRSCVYCREWTAPGFRDDCTDLDADDAERLSMWMPGNISPMRIAVLRVRYQALGDKPPIRHKRRAARWMGISEERYRGYFNDAIRAIESGFFVA